jgi:CRP-like cAMP-binding protein
VLEGSVRLHRDGQEITVARAKEAFGIWSLFDEEPRVVTATVAEDASLLQINRDDFIDLLADHVLIAQSILKTIAKRLRNLMERVG